VNEKRPVNVITEKGKRLASPPVSQDTGGVSDRQESLVMRARALATELLDATPILLEHAARSAKHAGDHAGRIQRSRAEEVIAAAWLHDIGYLPQLRRTGFHPLDGALYLMATGWPERVVRLVAHHSCAALEAPFYGVGHHLSVIEPVTGIDADLLISADLSAGSGATPPSIDERITALREVEEALGLVPVEVREARYAAMRSAHERVIALVN